MAVSHDDIDVPLVALVGFVGALVVFVIVVLLVAMYYNELEHQTAQKVGEPTWLHEIQTTQRQNLNKVSGQRVGIDEAMKQTRKEYQRQAQRQ